MSLTRIEYGSLASSETLNNNFNYLDNRISNQVQTSTSNMATVNSNIASINASVSALSDSIASSISPITATLSDSGLYITRYVNGNSWYTEYFSDSAKTNRVWLEQGFITPSRSWSANERVAYNLLQPFSNANYTVLATSTNIVLTGYFSSGNVAIENVSSTQIWIGNDSAGTFAVRVFACGQ